MVKQNTNHLESEEVIKLLRRINEGATASNASLGEILRLCMRLGKQLGNEELVKWARLEATGYKDLEQLPDYRILSTEVRANFNGPMGYKLTNAIMPKGAIDKAHQDKLFKAYMMEPVGELEKLSTAESDTGTLQLSWPGDIIAYYQRKEIYTNGLALGAAWRLISQSTISGILETIRTRVLDFVLEIEDELEVNSATLNKPDEISKPETEKVNQIVYNTIYGATNVAVGNSGGVIQNSVSVHPGDLESLKSYLKKIGLTNKLVKELDNALADDIDESIQPGPATQGWLGKVMIQVGKGTLSIASNASGSLIAGALMKYLGIT